MQERCELGRQSDVATPQDRPDHAKPDMPEAILPALLLSQPSLAIGRQLARHGYADQKHGSPALYPTAIGKVEVLGHGVALPTSAGLDGSALPDPAGAVERQRVARPIARRLLNPEMGVERDHLHLGECVLVRIEEVEARLHEGRPRLGHEDAHARAQKV